MSTGFITCSPDIPLGARRTSGSRKQDDGKASLTMLGTGTAHRGGGLPSTSKAEEEASPAATHRRETQIIKESWLHVSHKYTVVNFYETIPTLALDSNVRAVRDPLSSLLCSFARWLPPCYTEGSLANGGGVAGKCRSP